MIRLKLSGFTARDTQVSATVTCVLSIWFIVHNSSGDAKSCVSTGRTPPSLLMGDDMICTLANSRHTTPHILRNRDKTCMASERNTDKAIWLFRCKKTAATAVSFRSGGVMGVWHGVIHPCRSALISQPFSFRQRCIPLLAETTCRQPMWRAVCRRWCTHLSRYCLYRLPRETLCRRW